MTLVSTAAKGSGGASNLVKIADTLLGADAASIDITAIPAAYIHLSIVAMFRSANATATDFLLTRVNGDSGGNYYEQAGDFNNTVTSASQNIGQTRFLQNLIADTSTAGQFSVMQSLIPMYAGSQLKTFLTSEGGFAGIIGNFHWDAHTGLWNSSAAITRITYTTNSGANLKAGSRVTVYGLAVN